MKKILIILAIVFVLICLDSIQALVLDNPPILKIIQYYNGGDLYRKDKGIFVDSYLGTNGVRDTVLKGFSYSLTEDYINDVNYKRVAIYVEENERELYDIVQKALSKETVKLMDKINSVNVFVGTNTTVVEFSVNNLTKQYIGFYYSVNNIPATYQNASIELVKIAENVWKWKGEGDNFGRTVKIKDNWFYYEATF